MKAAHYRRVLIIVATVFITVAILLRLALSPIGFGIALRTQGLHLDSGHLEVGLRRTSGDHVVVMSDRGEPVFSADTLDAEYDLNSLLHGGPHAFGLIALHLRHPILHLIRRKDGSWNVPGLAGGSSKEQVAPEGPVLPPHVDFRAVVEEGVVEIDQPDLLDHAARALTVDHLTFAANVDSDRTSSYRLHAEIENQPLIAQGGIDSIRGVAIHRARVAKLPVATLLNAVVDSNAFVVHAGNLTDLTFTLSGSGHPGEAVIGNHMAGQSNLSDFDASVAGLETPLQRVSGQLVVTDDTVTFDRTKGEIAGMPFSASGGIFAFANPQLHITADGTGDLQDLRKLFTFSKTLPLAGTLTTHATIEGPASSPMVVVDLSDGKLHYDRMPVALERSMVIYDAGSVDLVPMNLRYGDIAFSGAGSIAVGDHVVPAVTINATAPSGSLPYLDGIFGGTTNAFAVLGGRDTALEGRAVIDGHDGTRLLRGLAHLDGRGEGVIGPIALEENGRTRILAGGAFVRPKGVFVGVVRADGAQVASSRAALPGLDLPRLPPIAATFNGTLGFTGDYKNFVLYGQVAANHLLYDDRYGADALDVAFGGDLRMLDIEHAEVRGPFGQLQVTGLAGTSGAAVAGALRGDLGVIGRVFGRSDLSGSIDLPVRAQSDGKVFAVDIDDAEFQQASAFGAPLQSLSLHAVGDGKSLNVSARAGVAGGEILAGGDLAHGIGVSGSRLSYPRLLPGAGFDVAAIVGGEGSKLHASGVALGDNVSVNGLLIAANTGFDADMNQVHLHGGIVQTGGLVAQVDGSVEDIAHGGKIDVRGHVVNASIAMLAHSLAPQSSSLYPNGSADADLHVNGTLAAPRVLGSIFLPEGSLSGLAFHDAKTEIDASSKRVRLRHGRVTVGTTNVHLGGAYDGKNFRSYVDAPRADLADFNNFFDQNNMLAGTGLVRVTAAAGTNNVRTLADIDLHNVRVSSFDLGTTQAHWRSQGSTINGSVGVNGLSGKLSVLGGVELPQERPRANLIGRSRLNLRGSASDLDLERWLPALGVTTPVTGRLDIAGSAVGTLPKLTADLTIDARGASVGPVPIDDAHAHLVARNGRGTVQQAHVVVRGADADASGTFGFSPNDPVAIALHAQAPDIGDLATNIVHALRSERANRLGLNDVGVKADQAVAALAPLNGAASTSISVKGSMAKPQISGALDIEKAHIRGLSLPRLIASFDLRGTKLNLTDAEIALEKGEFTVAGSLPLVLSPFSIGPADAPLSLSLSADAVDLSSFVSLLPAKSELHGLLDGAIALEGTPASPKLFGELDLGGASFVSPLETVPIRSVSSTLRLGGRTANLAASATVGGGVFSLDGRASVENLTAIGHHTDYTLHASAKHANVDLANYGKGTLDADVTVSHVDGGVPHVAGSVALSDSQIPFSVFYNPSATNTSVSNSLFAETALDVKLIAGKNTRIRSGSIDLGASGAATLGGTISKPTLDGAFSSTGGTLTYFNRSFRVASGRVSFDPADGIDPYITASATTTAEDPDTNTARNLSGRVTISLNVTGTLDRLNVGLTSDPSYDRQQILGLLLNAPLLGAVHFNQGTGASGTTNNGLNLPGASTSTAQVSVSQEAFSVVNAQFTQSLLAPISSAIGGAVGLSDLAVNFDQSGAIDLSARRHIFGNVYAFFRDSLGVPARQSLGVDFEPNDATAVSVSVFQEQGLSTLGRSNNAALFTPQQSLQSTASSASGGATTSGVSFSLNKRFP